MRGNDTQNTTIGSQLKVKGNISSDHDVTINGIVVGNVTTSSLLVIGKDGVIEGKIVADSAVIHGQVKGNLTIASSLTLANTARVLGDLECQSLAVERGAFLEGRITMPEESNNNDAT